MFKIYDGRDYFYQWDLNRKLIVNDDSIKEVHFCNRTEDCSLVSEVYTENGINLVNVPNILLQKCFCVYVYGYDGESTKYSANFNVLSRSKPADYVYTETEVKTWAAMEQTIADLEKSLSKYQLKIKTLTALNSSDAIKVWELETGIYRISGYMVTEIENGVPGNALNFDSDSLLIVNKKYSGGNIKYTWCVFGEFVNHYISGYVPIKCGSFFVNKSGKITSQQWNIQGENIVQDIASNANNSGTYPSTKAVAEYVANIKPDNTEELELIAALVGDVTSVQEELEIAANMIGG